MLPTILHWISNLSNMNVPGEGYYVPGEGYYVPGEGYYVPGEGYSRHVTCRVH
jgi:hypothetical protein